MLATAPKRSIPAWAGEATLVFSPRTRIWVDPRVGGGSWHERASLVDGEGRSPRGRGKHLVLGRKLDCQRSIPAWAGEALADSDGGQVFWVDPRVGGGSSPKAGPGTLGMGRSPRGRGKHPLLPAPQRGGGSIPAWAGEATQSRNQTQRLRVDPRVGGGSTLKAAAPDPAKGRSPRGRGKLTENGQVVQIDGSIPAWAGEARNRPRPAWARWVDPRVGGGSLETTSAGASGGGRSPRGRGKPWG